MDDSMPAENFAVLTADSHIISYHHII